jgi:phenylalanine-4-hydroxylase
MLPRKKSNYIAKPVDAEGNAAYTAEDNAIWNLLIERQIPLVKERACDEYVRGLELLNLTHDRIPQCHEVSRVLKKETGWALEPVPALIPFDHFFKLLANRQFPAATFIRRKEEIDYLQEPDIFHEIFGHCPLLTNQAYADFTHTYGKLGLKATPAERVMLAKIYWFTIEFGLLKTDNGLRIYGGGILSSKNETMYCLDSDKPVYRPFDVMDILRMPYRIDIIQPVYFIIDSFDVLFQLTDMDLIGMIHEAKKLPMYEPLFEGKAP